MRRRSKRARTASAIGLAAALGRRIQDDHPEVVGMYRSLVPLSTIVRRLRLMDDYGASWHVARNAVVYAIRGHHKGCGLKCYDGLITDADELSRITLAYRKLGGLKLKRQKKGIFNQSPEEQTEAGRKGATAIGGIVFTKREVEYALKLCSNPRFCYAEGRPKGKPKLKAIAQELNRRFHRGRAVRTRYSVNYLRGRSKRRNPA